jgi:metal-sulfur cluster biosynthetic enzyme
VYDPEVGEPILDLGLVERVEVVPGRVDVTLIATSATCPMTDVLLEDVIAAVATRAPPGTTIDARIDWDVAWTPARMSPALQERFGWSGS